ncbi:MAG: hypothetical protein R6U25_00170 [Alkalispirochaeta sp.]
MRFEVRRNPKRGQTILILAAAFTVFSVLAFMLAGFQAGVLLLVASGVMLLVFTVDQGKLGWYYEVSDGSLTVRRTLRTYVLAGDSIEKAVAIGWPAVRERVQRYRSGDGPAGGGSRQVALGRLIGFCSISVPLRGPVPQSREKFVLLTRSGEREYILSPADPEGFVKACQRLMSRTR